MSVERKVGFGVFLFILLFLALFLYPKFSSIGLYRQMRVIFYFDDIGILRIQDLVKQNGLVIGQVESIRHGRVLDIRTGDSLFKAVVHVTLTGNVKLHADDTVILRDVPGDLMGNREIFIKAGRGPASADVSVPFWGITESGIADYIKDARKLTEKVQRLRQLALELKTTHKPGHVTFIEQYCHALKEVQLLLNGMEGVVKSVDQSLSPCLEQAAAVSGSTRRAFSQTGMTMLPALEKAERWSADMVNTLETLKIRLSQAQERVAVIQGHDHFIGRQISDAALYEKLVHLVDRLECLVKTLGSSGVPGGIVNVDVF